MASTATHLRDAKMRRPAFRIDLRSAVRRNPRIPNYEQIVSRRDFRPAGRLIDGRPQTARQMPAVAGDGV